MQVSFIKCDICYEETKAFQTYYVETKYGETQNIRYDICKKCEGKINELINEIRESKIIEE